MNANETIKIGSRESRLAVAQAKQLISCLHQHHPEIKTELITMKTTGDLILDRPLDQIGGKGLFVKELDRALLGGSIDLAVHSLKDMPAQVNPEIPIVAVSQREDPRDVLVSRSGSPLDFDLPIGCAGARRRVQLARLIPGCAVAPVRGNLLTRLQKLDAGEYGSLALAAAGLKRLGLQQRISRFFEVDEMIPAACQGILAVQARKEFNMELLRCFHDQDAWDASLAEREFINTLDGGCSQPVAAYAVTAGQEIKITGLYVNEEQGIYRIGSMTGERAHARRLGFELAAELKIG